MARVPGALGLGHEEPGMTRPDQEGQAKAFGLNSVDSWEPPRVTTQRIHGTKSLNRASCHPVLLITKSHVQNITVCCHGNSNGPHYGNKLSSSLYLSSKELKVFVVCVFFSFFLFLNRSTRWRLRERRKPKDCWIKGDFKGMEGKTSWILKGLIKTDGRISQPEGRGKLSQNTSEVGASSPLLSGSLSAASLQADSSSWLMRKERRVGCVCVGVVDTRARVW